jgi:hypothetical protein
MRKPGIPLPTVLDWNVSDSPPVPVVQVSLEERFRSLSTRTIEEYLLMNVMVPEAEVAALAELARRGVEPPKTDGANP